MKINYKKLKNNIPIIVKAGKSKKGNYEVVYVNDFIDGNTLGETTFDKKQIRIKNNLTEKQTVLVFFHEVFHALSAEFNINLTENQVLALEKASPNLIKLIKEMDNK